MIIPGSTKHSREILNYLDQHYEQLAKMALWMKSQERLRVFLPSADADALVARVNEDTRFASKPVVAQTHPRDRGILPGQTAVTIIRQRRQAA